VGVRLFSRLGRTLARINQAYREGGVYYVARCGATRVFDLTIGYYYYRVFRSSATFLLQERTFRYFYHKYNKTWRSERAVEVPIFWELVKENRGKNILEVGNVLSHYFPVNHDVLDKYEMSRGVINQDVVDFQPSVQYDLIISISTLEHVGWDESPREPGKILRAIDNLCRCLSPGGKIVATLPLGYNTDMDLLLDQRKIPFTAMHCLKRGSTDNRWAETDWSGVNNTKYNDVLVYAKGIIVGVIKKDAWGNLVASASPCGPAPLGQGRIPPYENSDCRYT